MLQSFLAFEILKHNIVDEYTFGLALLVNPVYEFKARTRSVYLPAELVVVDTSSLTS